MIVTILPVCVANRIARDCSIRAVRAADRQVADCFPDDKGVLVLHDGEFELFTLDGDFVCRADHSLVSFDVDFRLVGTLLDWANMANRGETSQPCGGTGPSQLQLL